MTNPHPFAAAAAAVLLLIGVPACGGDETDGTEEAPVTSVEPLPDVAVRDLDGTEHALRDLIQGPTVVNFWATWCVPCKRELPELASLHEDLRERGGRVLGIALASGTAEEIRTFARSHGADFPHFQASQAWAERHFGLYGLPTTLIVDGRGGIRERLVGAQTRESLMERLTPLLEGG